jgi:hypothetical protein
MHWGFSTELSTVLLTLTVMIDDFLCPFLFWSHDWNWTLGKGKAVLLHAMEALGGRGGIAPTHSRPRHCMGVSGHCHAPAALLPPGKGPPVPIVQEAGWAPEPVWTQRLEEKSFASAGDRTPIARNWDYSLKSKTVLYWIVNCILLC